MIDPCSKKETSLIDTHTDGGNYAKHKQKPRRTGKAFVQREFQATATLRARIRLRMFELESTVRAGAVVPSKKRECYLFLLVLVHVPIV